MFVANDYIRNKMDRVWRNYDVRDIEHTACPRSSHRCDALMKREVGAFNNNCKITAVAVTGTPTPTLKSP